MTGAARPWGTSGRVQLLTRAYALDKLVLVDDAEVGSVWRRRKNEWRAGPWDPYVGHIKATTSPTFDAAVRSLLTLTGHEDLAAEQDEP